MRFHVDIYDSSCSGRRPHVISDLPLQLLPSSALSPICGCLSLLASLCALPFSLPGPRCCCFGSCCCFCLLCCCFSRCFRCTSCLLCLCFCFFFVGVLFLSSADLTATVMVLHSGRSPQGEGRRKCDTSSTRVDAEVCVCISSQLPLATSLQMISN